MDFPNTVEGVIFFPIKFQDLYIIFGEGGDTFFMWPGPEKGFPNTVDGGGVTNDHSLQYKLCTLVYQIIAVILL